LVEQHVIAATDVSTLDHVGVLDLIGGAFVDSLVTDAVSGAVLELAEHQPVRLGRCVPLDRN
jgi:hypothetical protein